MIVLQQWPAFLKTGLVKVENGRRKGVLFLFESFELLCMGKSLQAYESTLAKSEKFNIL